MQANKPKQSTRAPSSGAKSQATTKSAAKAFSTRHRDLLEITHGGHDYIECVLNPRTGPLAAVPYGFPVRSRRIRVKCTGTFTSAVTAGSVPFVAVCPWRLVANDANGVKYSDGTYATPASSNFAAASTGVLNANSNSEYTKSSLNAEAMVFRLVGASLEVSSQTAVLSRSGALVNFTEPAHENLLSQGAGAIVGQSADSIMSYEGCRVRAVPVSDRIEKAIWGVPEKPSEADWLSYFSIEENDSYLQTMGLTQNEASDYIANDPSMAPWYSYNMIAFAPGSADGTSSGTYRYEVYAVFELSGRTVTGKQPGCSDPVAYQAAANWIQRTPGSTQVPSSARDALRYLGQSLGYVTPEGNVSWGAVVNTATKAASLF